MHTEGAPQIPFALCVIEKKRWGNEENKKRNNAGVRKQSAAQVLRRQPTIGSGFGDAT